MKRYFWEGPNGLVPCNVLGRTGDLFRIRIPDPYDRGEVEMTVPAEEIIDEANRPERVRVVAKVQVKM